MFAHRIACVFYTNNEQSGKEMRKNNLTISINNMYFEVNLAKEVKYLYNEDYTILAKAMKKITRRGTWW